MVVMVTWQYDCTTHLTMVKMVNFMLCVFYHDKKKWKRIIELINMYKAQCYMLAQIKMWMVQNPCP